MHTLRIEIQKIDMVRTMISLGMVIMESFGFIAFICGILGIKIF